MRVSTRRGRIATDGGRRSGEPSRVLFPADLPDGILGRVATRFELPQNYKVSFSRNPPNFTPLSRTSPLAFTPSVSAVGEDEEEAEKRRRLKKEEKGRNHAAVLPLVPK